MPLVLPLELQSAGLVDDDKLWLSSDPDMLLPFSPEENGRIRYCEE
jgi:hypothetical protein